MELRNPVIYIESPGYCSKCHNPTLYLLEGNVDISHLSKEGILNFSKPLRHESTIICLTCNERYQYEKKGIYILPTTGKVDKPKVLNIKEVNPFSI